MLAQMPGYASSRSDRSALVHALFSAGQQGALYDPSDLSTLFQDAAGTTPVTADSQPVGRMLDISGNGKHASQATSAARPLYRTAGGLHWLFFDGVDDELSCPMTVPSANTALVMAVGYQKDTDQPLNTWRGVVSLGINSTRQGMGISTQKVTGDPNAKTAGYVPSMAELFDPDYKFAQPIVGVFHKNNARSLALRIDGAEVAAATMTEDLALASNALLQFSKRHSGEFGQIRLHGAAVVFAEFSAATRIIEQWLADKSGATLV